jgi:glutamate--cysteine ligase
MESGEERPDSEDLEHHLTTLFPPVRPRHHFEVRYLDAQPRRWLPVAVATIAALAYDDGARAEAQKRLGDIADTSPLGWAPLWRRAAIHGVADAAIRSLASDLIEIALHGMNRLPNGYVPADVTRLCRDFLDTYPRAGRCPGDDQLEKFNRCPEDISTWM